MEISDAYKDNPCGVLSIPYWKNKYIEIPPNMKILHENDFRHSNHSEYMDEPYFRLYHSLEKIDAIALDGISIVTAKQDDIPLFVEVRHAAVIALTRHVHSLMAQA